MPFYFLSEGNLILQDVGKNDENICGQMQQKMRGLIVAWSTGPMKSDLFEWHRKRMMEIWVFDMPEVDPEKRGRPGNQTQLELFVSK